MATKTRKGIQKFHGPILPNLYPSGKSIVDNLMTPIIPIRFGLFIIWVTIRTKHIYFIYWPQKTGKLKLPDAKRSY